MPSTDVEGTWHRQPRGHGFYLAGRTDASAATDLAQWITDPDETELAVVTGSPGTGKSSLLALMTLLADDATRDNLLRHTTTTSIAHQAAHRCPERPISSPFTPGASMPIRSGRIATDPNWTRTGHTHLELLRNNASPPGADSFGRRGRRGYTKPHSVRDDLLPPLTQCGVRVVFRRTTTRSAAPDMPAMTSTLDTAAQAPTAATKPVPSHLPSRRSCDRSPRRIFLVAR